MSEDEVRELRAEVEQKDAELEKLKIRNDEHVIEMAKCKSEIIENKQDT